jgi:pimeloyl-ACP methyl ester carboxylesterase
VDNVAGQLTGFKGPIVVRNHQGVVRNTVPALPSRTSLHVIRSGEGPPLLLVHGVGHSAGAWRRVRPLLEPVFECFAVDLPGFGRSPTLGRPATMRDLAAACRAVMADAGHPRFHVAGNSLGGGVALQLAFDGVALSACALSPVGFAEGWERPFVHVSLMTLFAAGPALARAVPVAGRVPAVRRALFAQYAAHADRVPVGELVEDLHALNAATGLRDVRRHALNWRCPARPAPAGSPVTIAWGDKDRLLLFRPQFARARARVPDARHLTLHDIGHLPMFDDPGRVADVIHETAR